MVKIALVTDSTSDIPKSVLEQRGINCVALKVHFGDEVYRDGVDMTAEEFYSKLASSQVIPKSSQPSPSDFVDIYEKLLDEYDYIISIHISSGLSGTYHSATVARDEYLKSGADKVFIFDSKTVSCPLGVLVMQVDEAIKRGYDIEKVLEVTKWSIDNTGLLAIVDTLLYLEKNGRIGKASAFLGGLLSLKPVLTAENGGLVGIDRIRGNSKVIPRVLELMHDMTKIKGTKINCMVAHGNDVERGKHYMDAIEKEFDCETTTLSFCGPVVGSHGGPKVISVGWVPVYPFEQDK